MFQFLKLNEKIHFIYACATIKRHKNLIFLEYLGQKTNVVIYIKSVVIKTQTISRKSKKLIVFSVLKYQSTIHKITLKFIKL